MIKINVWAATEQKNCQLSIAQLLETYITCKLLSNIWNHSYLKVRIFGIEFLINCKKYIPFEEIYYLCRNTRQGTLVSISCTFSCTDKMFKVMHQSDC